MPGSEASGYYIRGSKVVYNQGKEGCSKKNTMYFYFDPN